MVQRRIWWNGGRTVVSDQLSVVGKTFVLAGASSRFALRLSFALPFQT
jgi:hypothetical protein